MEKFYNNNSSPHCWIFLDSSFVVQSFSLPTLFTFVIVWTSNGQVLPSIALRLKAHIPIFLNLDSIFFVSDCSKAWSTHPTKVILYGSMSLLLNIDAFLTFLNVVLKGLKQDTYNGCNVCNVCDGSVIMSNPNSFACFIAFRVTWLPCHLELTNVGWWNTFHLELTF